MTYITGGNVQATDYNTFSTLAASMNEVFADLYPGATTLPTAAYGYGQTPALTSVVAGNSVLASEWAALYNSMRNCGTHQGTPVSPPVPGPNPVAGNSITAYNTPSTLASIVSVLRTNRFALAPGQSFLTAGTSYPQSVPNWTNTLTWHYQADFGSWNNARYFFNSGGSLRLNGTYTPNTTPEDAQWISMFATMSPLSFLYASTSPNSGSGGTGIGFYGLTTSYQNVYFKTFGSGYYYVNSSITLQAKLNAAAGTNGLVDFRVIMTDADPTPDVKTSTTTFRVDNLKSSGAIVYPGTVTIINNGYLAT
jgi:hypothetical protein